VFAQTVIRAHSRFSDWPKGDAIEACFYKRGAGWARLKDFLLSSADEDAARVAAAQALLDRAYGKPAQSIGLSCDAALRIIVDYADDAAPGAARAEGTSRMIAWGINRLMRRR